MELVAAFSFISGLVCVAAGAIYLAFPKQRRQMEKLPTYVTALGLIAFGIILIVNGLDLIGKVMAQK